MTRVMLVLGWGLAIVAAGIAGAASYVAVTKSRELTQMQEQLAALSNRIAAADVKVEQLTKLEKEREATKAASTSAPNVDMKSAMEALKTALTPGKEGGETGKSEAPFAGMFSGEKGKEVAKMGASMAVNMQYADLFSQLQLTPEVEQRVKDIISASMSEQMTMGMDAMGGKASMGDLHKRAEDSKAKLRADLSKVLTSDQMAAYDQYQQEMPERMMSQSIDMQLSMFAGSLSSEDRTQARQVIVEEMLAAGGGTDSTGIPANGNMQEHLQKQQAALQRARDRLAETFDADKIAQVDRFVAQLNQIMDMSAAMFAGKQPQGNTTNKTP